MVSCSLLTESRNRLVADQYPFTFGYELVSIDGQDPMMLVEKFGKYNAAVRSGYRALKLEVQRAINEIQKLRTLGR